MCENNLWESYNNCAGNEYYEKINVSIEKCFKSEKNAYNFIKNYSAKGGKLSLPVFFDKNIYKFSRNGKHLHSVSLYFLGKHLKYIIIDKTKRFFYKYIESDKLNSFWDFRYSWFLLSLYHDFASKLENKSSIKVDFIVDLVSFNNLFEHILVKNNQTLESPYYKRNTITNYAKWRYSKENRNDKKLLDHGILCGYIIYAEYLKLYNSLLETHKNDIDFNEEIGEFKDNDLAYSKITNDHFAIIAHTIMCHNMFNIYKNENNNEIFDEKIKIYKKYKLNELIIDNSFNPDSEANGNKINIEKAPLLFFLDLLDTIEPIKAFSKSLSKRFTAKNILENISINFQYPNHLKIEAYKDCFDSESFERWSSNIKDLENWMDLTVEIPTDNDNERVFKLHFNVSNNSTNENPPVS